MAGRGTDILLGGNPKGLVALLLGAKLLPLLAKGACRGAYTVPRAATPVWPLQGSAVHKCRCCAC